MTCVQSDILSVNELDDYVSHQYVIDVILATWALPNGIWSLLGSICFIVYGSFSHKPFKC